ncbi:Bifunctional epoxide hydrolase 2 [Glycine soja]
MVRRHQMIAAASAGYQAIAFDFRGYGLSEHPAEPEKAKLLDLVDDVVGLIDSLSITKVVLVGKDFGAVPAYILAALHPDKEPGRAEADCCHFDVKSVIRNIYTLFSGSEILAGDNQEIMDLYNPSTPLPPWFSEEDLATYVSLYEKPGFRFALQVPYSLGYISNIITANNPHGTLGVDSGISDPKITVPALLMMGEKDYVVFKSFGMEDYIQSGTVKNFVPDLEIIYISGSHLVHEQFPEKVNQLIIEFLNKQKHLIV